MIVAESLRRVPEPVLLPGSSAVADGPAVAAAIAGALEPAAAADPAPHWLRPDQHTAFRRALAAIRRYDGAMVAEPVGTGKTFIALAVAAAFGGEAHCVVPASLGPQWLRAARRCGYHIEVTTHEQWSRGPRRLGPGPVIIDESHRFRNPVARRYLHLAPALVGRQGLLLTASPVVNTLEDLAHQLLLLVRDDALASSGIESLIRSVVRSNAWAALSYLIIMGTTRAEKPMAIERSSVPSPLEDRAAGNVLRCLARLHLSPSRGVRQLILGIFAQALASSPAALHAALDRYRQLLLQAQDAARSGHELTRAALRRALWGDPAQLVFWELLDTEPGQADLDPRDLPRLETVLVSLRRGEDGVDGKVERLRGMIDGRTTVVFTAAQATVHHLRRQLGPANRIAWCTGGEAGIGPTRLPREQVLQWFQPGGGDRNGLGPPILITTDVASEGLNLQRAERVVHYDLPWTDVRLHQRAGRAIRLGSPHPSVEVVTFLPPPVLERRLGLRGAISRKRQLAERVGLDERVRQLAQWRHGPLVRSAPVAVRPGIGEAVDARHAAVAAIRLWRGPDPVATCLLVQSPDGTWTENREEVLSAVDAAVRGAIRGPLDRVRAGRTLRQLSAEIRRLVLRVDAGCRGLRTLPPAEGAGLRRVQELAAEAVRGRNAGTIEAAERGLAFLRRGHTAGERLLVSRLDSLTADQLIEVLRTLPAGTSAPAVPIRASLIGVIRFRAP